MTDDFLDLNGAVAFVTGAGQGAGRAIALTLARHGADDVAAMATFLSSDGAEWMTGQTYPLNGGYSFAV